jgi:adenylosuccinate synthase
MAVGKTSIANILEKEYGFHRIRSSKFLFKIAQDKGLSPTRQILQDLGDKLDAQTDFSWVIHDVAIPEINNKPESSLWLFDAVRKEKQVMHFKSQLKSFKVAHLHITASEKTLLDRYLTRTPEASLDEYYIAKNHPNEVSACQLKHIADSVILADEISNADTVKLILDKIKGLDFA